MEKSLKIFLTTLAVIFVALIGLLILSIFSENLGKQPAEEKQEESLLGEQTQQYEDAEEFIIETLEEGEGEEAKAGDILTVHYEGRLLDGQVFDTSYDREEPFVFVLGEGRVIQGWEEGVAGMKVGEKRLLTIPSHMGYGEMGSGNIPPNAGLEFEVKMLEINRENGEN